MRESPMESDGRNIMEGIPTAVLAGLLGWLSTGELLNFRTAAKDHHNGIVPPASRGAALRPLVLVTDQALAVNLVLGWRFRAFVQDQDPTARRNRNRNRNLSIKKMVRNLCMVERWLRRSQYGRSPQRGSWLLRSRNYVLESVKRQPRFLARSGWEAWLTDREIVMVSVRGSRMFLPSHFRDDVEMVKAYLVANPWRGAYALSNRLLQDRSMVLFALQRGGGIRNVKEDWKDDKELALAAIQSRGYDYHYLSDRLQSDSDVLRALFLSGIGTSSSLSMMPPNRVNEIFLAGLAAK